MSKVILCLAYQGATVLSFMFYTFSNIFTLWKEPLLFHLNLLVQRTCIGVEESFHVQSEHLIKTLLDFLVSQR